MVVVRGCVGGVAIAGVEIVRIAAIGQQMREDLVAVHGDTDLGAMRGRFFAANEPGGGGRSVEAGGDRVIVVADMGVDVAAAIIERRNRIGAEDGVDRRRSIEPDTVIGDARTRHSGLSRSGCRLRLKRNDVGHRGIIGHVFGQALHAVIVVGRIDIGAGGGLA